MLFGVCILTASWPLYEGPISAIVGRLLVRMIHVWTGLALPIPVLRPGSLLSSAFR